MRAPTFTTGKPCKRGHFAPRLVSSGACTECSKLANAARYLAKYDEIRARIKKYQLENPEKYHVWEKAWRERNAESEKARGQARYRADPEKYKAMLRAWNKANPERTKVRIESWRKANPAKHAAISARRRAAILKATPQWADQDAIDVVYLYAQIRREFGENVEVDHFYPLQGKHVCGLHVHDNLRIIPQFDNRSKSNHLLQEH